MICYKAHFSLKMGVIGFKKGLKLLKLIKNLPLVLVLWSCLSELRMPLYCIEVHYDIKFRITKTKDVVSQREVHN
jgi:hypothetical protein